MSINDAMNFFTVNDKMAIHKNQNGIDVEANSRCKFLSKHLAENCNTYILHTAVNSNSDVSVAVALSNNTIKIYPIISNLNSSIALTGHKKQITGLKFSKEQPHVLFSSSLDGNVYSWDTRCRGLPTQSFSDKSGEMAKPFTSFDVNADERVICTGTELIREDSFLIFWDRRTSKNLGGYWDSHTDDVTQVLFHPSQISVMASGSIDGLINIFDLNQDNEDDALLHTLNTGSSVSKLKWETDGLSKRSAEHISCITHIEEFQLWLRDEAHPSLACDRNQLFEKSKCQVDYFIDSFSVDGQLFVASGANNGTISLWSMKKNPVMLAMLGKEHKDIVRTLTWNAENNLLVSGAEDGLICLWKFSPN